MSQMEFEEVSLVTDETEELIPNRGKIKIMKNLNNNNKDINLVLSTLTFTEEVTIEATAVIGGTPSSDRYISDVIKVTIIPEKKGNFLKYTAYEVSLFTSIISS